MERHQFFGYGSLVNRATHGYANVRTARLAGWRRIWVHTSLRPVAYLSVEQAEVEIDGLVAEVATADWAALDERERAYDRHPVTAELHDCGSPAEAVVYAVPASHAAHPDLRHPLLLSYIDVVVQGFLREFGEAGVGGFFATTAGWDAPVIDDRAAPIYSRAQALSVAERLLVDKLLADTPAQRHSFEAWGHPYES